MPQTEHLTVAQAAKILGESRWTTARRIREGTLPAVRLGDGPTAAYMIRYADVEALRVEQAGAA